MALEVRNPIAAARPGAGKGMGARSRLASALAETEQAAPAFGGLLTGAVAGTLPIGLTNPCWRRLSPIRGGA